VSEVDVAAVSLTVAVCIPYFLKRRTLKQENDREAEVEYRMAVN